MELYLIIALIKHSKKEDFGGLLGVHLMLILDRGPCSPEVSKPKRGSLEDHFSVY